MTYKFVCEACKAETEVSASIKIGPPEVVCECGHKMRQDWTGGGAIIIPEHMKATEAQDFSTWKTRMAKSRPSGRTDRIYY